MQTITTTQLRTKSKELVNVLKEGQSVQLIHRSKVVGEIKPKIDNPKPLTESDIDKLIKIAQKLNLPKLSYAQREKIYRAEMLKKHGKNLS